MLLRLKQEEFTSLDAIALQKACIELLFTEAHKNTPAFRGRGLQLLNPGQQALFLFHILSDYVGETTAEFYDRVSYLLLRDKRTWLGIKGGLRYFKDDAMLQLLEETESLFATHPGLVVSILTFSDLEKHPEMHIAVQQLCRTYHEIISATLIRMGTHIRNHSDEFVEIEG